jgi:branched-chain amino acid transport system substrate-binding protein
LLRISVVRAAIVVGLAFAVATGAAAAASVSTSPAVHVAPAIGVTRTTVTVGGILSSDLASAGADVGAQARFARVNARGGVAGRTIQYSGTESDAADPAQDTAAVQKLASSVFAVVPAVSGVLDTAALAQARVPFFGAADTTGWNANRFGFGFVGAQAARQTRVVSPAWGAQLRSLLGRAQGSEVSIVVDATELGAARGEQARVSLRAAGFTVAPVVTLPAPPAPLPDLAPVATQLTSGSPAVVMVLTSPSTTTALARQLTILGFTGTVATPEAFYQPARPALAGGLTVLVPYAPFEQSTAANRRLAADVEKFAPGTALTPGVAAGYWSAEAFVAVLARVGKRLTAARFLAAANHGEFSFGVPATVGRSTWPAMHSQPVSCGALVQSDGTRYFVAERYRCGDPVVPKPKKTESKQAKQPKG